MKVLYAGYSHGRLEVIKKWFNAFTTDSINPWEQFTELFLCAHQNYDYVELCDEIKYLQGEEDESSVDFDSMIIHNYYRFHDDD
jgi:hypothetical protein